ncbi:G-protein coupled receptor 4-like [Polypterus senegalus]|uniref:G-protein coupled receptor 4-like n=1 Tax=Polypterus senegalus TaxID=55291 RepID=UPI0019661E1E|nr:G-protein coupled receptor 4-like [Polypterus senegalus]
MNNCHIDFSSQRDLLPGLYGAIFCVALPTNCLALYGLYKLLKAEDSLPVYVINLLLTDILQIVTLPLWIDYYKNGHVWRFHEVTCDIFGVLLYISLLGNVGFLSLIAVERYIAVAHPLWYKNFRRLSNACILCLALWGLFTGISLLVWYFKRENSKYLLCFENYPATNTFSILCLSMSVFLFPLPLALLIFIYIRIEKSLRNLQSVPDESKKKIKYLLITIVLIFILVYGPFCTTALIRFVGLLIVSDKCQHESKMFYAYRCTFALLNVTSLLDPVFYILISKDICKELKELFPFIFRQIRPVDSSSE